MLRRTMAVAGAVAALTLAACGGDSTTTPTATPTPAPAPVITIVASPSEAAATPSADPGYQWTASFSVTLTESAGVALTVRSVNVNVQQAAGGIVVTPPTGLSEAFRYQIKSPGNRLPGNGTLTLDVTVLYTLPQPGQEALTTVSFTLVDDSGTVGTQTTQVKVV